MVWNNLKEDPLSYTDTSEKGKKVLPNKKKFRLETGKYFYKYFLFLLKMKYSSHNIFYVPLTLDFSV